MELVWMLVGAGALGLVLWFRATKKRVRDAAYTEFAEMLAAIDRVQKNPRYLEIALPTVATYLTRVADAQVHPTKLPADRALLASYWLQALIDSRLLDSSGKRITDHPAPEAFWNTVDTLHFELTMRQHLQSARG